MVITLVLGILAFALAAKWRRHFGRMIALSFLGVALLLSSWAISSQPTQIQRCASQLQASAGNGVAAMEDDSPACNGLNNAQLQQAISDAQNAIQNEG